MTLSPHSILSQQLQQQRDDDDDDDDSTHSGVVSPLPRWSPRRGRRGVAPAEAVSDAELDTIPPSTDEAVAALQRNEGLPLTPPPVPRVPDNDDADGGQDHESVASSTASSTLSWSRALVIDESTPVRLNPAHELLSRGAVRGDGEERRGEPGSSRAGGMSPSRSARPIVAPTQRAVAAAGLSPEAPPPNKH